MVLAFKTLGIQFVHILCPRRAGGKPAVRGHYLESADGSAVAGRMGQLRVLRVARLQRGFRPMLVIRSRCTGMTGSAVVPIRKGPSTAAK